MHRSGEPCPRPATLHSCFHSPAVIHALARTRVHDNDFSTPIFIGDSLLLQELADGHGPFTGFLEHGHVTCAFEHDEFRTGYQPVACIAIDGRSEAVILPPDHQRWANYTFQPPLQPG